jgi:hypothetical protein
MQWVPKSRSQQSAGGRSEIRWHTSVWSQFAIVRRNLPWIAVIAPKYVPYSRALRIPCCSVSNAAPRLEHALPLALTAAPIGALLRLSTGLCSDAFYVGLMRSWAARQPRTT